MFYILLCFYLWIYGTLNKISYQIISSHILTEHYTKRIKQISFQCCVYAVKTFFCLLHVMVVGPLTLKMQAQMQIGVHMKCFILIVPNLDKKRNGTKIFHKILHYYISYKPTQ